MHVLKHRDKKASPVVPIISQWKVPFHRRLRGKRYNAKGEFIRDTGPSRIVDFAAQRAVREAYREAAKMPFPEEGGGFDLKRYCPMPGKMLLKRGPLITEEGGIAIPDDKQKHVPWFYVICVGAGVTNCAVGDRVLFSKTWKPKPVRLGEGRFHMGKAHYVIGTVEAD